MQFGMTALHHAAHSGQVDSIRMLVQELHVDPDIKDIVSQACTCVLRKVVLPLFLWALCRMT